MKVLGVVLLFLCLPRISRDIGSVFMDSLAYVVFRFRGVRPEGGLAHAPFDALDARALPCARADSRSGARTRPCAALMS